MSNGLVDELNFFNDSRRFYLDGVVPHDCLMRREYICFQKDAIVYAIDFIGGVLSRLRRKDVGRAYAERVLLFGEESELDGFMKLDENPDFGRNFNSFAIGYFAGHCGYTCPERVGCRLARLFQIDPNYSHENPEELEGVVKEFCHDLGFGLIDLPERDAIARCLVEHKWFVSTKGDVGLAKAEEDFERKYNKFFIDLGFKLGRSKEYAACSRDDFLSRQWMQMVHGVDLGAND